MNRYFEKIHTENIVADGIKKVSNGAKKLIGLDLHDTVEIDTKKHGELIADANESYQGMLNNNWRSKKSEPATAASQE